MRMYICGKSKRERKIHVSKTVSKKCVRMLAKRIARSHETESCYGYSQLNGNPATNGVSTFKSFNSFYSKASNCWCVCVWHSF